MMRSKPEDDYDRAELERLNAPQWMVDLLGMNPSYTCWGPFEDYMATEGGWSGRLVHPTWGAFRWGLDDLNECVNFYFEIGRGSKGCEACGESGYNPGTRAIAETFYDHMAVQWTGRADAKGWHASITQDEADVLHEEGRLWGFEGKPTADEVNRRERGRGLGHDAINRGILVKTRAKRHGVWGSCEACGGHGYTFTDAEAHLSLVLWWLHPRKGCSRGVRIERIVESDLPHVFEFLRQAAQRNADRFASVCRAAEERPVSRDAG